MKLPKKEIKFVELRENFFKEDIENVKFELNALRESNELHALDSYLLFLRNDAHYFKILLSKKYSTPTLPIFQEE